MVEDEGVSGNVRISVVNGRLTVTSPASQPRSILLGIPFALFFLYRSLSLLTSVAGGVRHDPNLHFTAALRGQLSPLVQGLLLFVFFAAFAFGVIRSLAGGHEVLKADGVQLEIERVDFGRLWSRKTFPLAELRQIRFGVVHVSKDNATMGLVFEASGKKLKYLAGLKAPEADRILKELRSLGADVQMDVAMPMMVEIEQSRRKSVWRILG